MADRQKDIDFLVEYRRLVDEYLFLGMSPTINERAYDFNPEAASAFEQKSSNRQFQELRRKINEGTQRALRLLVEANTNPTAEWHPPLLEGGPTQNYNLLDLLTENRSEFNVPKSTILDAIDRAIGYLKSNPPVVAIKSMPKGEYVFISHSSRDTAVISAIEQAFDDLPLKPYFLEDRPGGQAPVKEIAEMVRNSRALFAFFTPNSLFVETRDWITFEIGVAAGCGIEVFSWRQKPLDKTALPRFLEQLSRYRDFDSYGEGALALARDIRAAAKGVCPQ